MKNIKILVFFAALLLSSIIYAQAPRGNSQQNNKQVGNQGSHQIPDENQIKEMLSELALDISLSNEQESNVLKLYTEHFEEVKTKTSGNTKPKREEMEVLRKDFEKSVKAILTYEQQAAYDFYLEKLNTQNQKR